MVTRVSNGVATFVAKRVSLILTQESRRKEVQAHVNSYVLVLRSSGSAGDTYGCC